MRLTASLRALVGSLALLMAAAPAQALDKNKARYVGGAVQSVPIDAEGALAAVDGARLVFVADDEAGTIEVRFSEILDAKYGQNLEKGVKTLFRKKRQHFLWITYDDDPDSPAESTIMFELGKEIVVETLDAVEQGTGRRVVYADAEAAKFRREQKR